MEDNPDKDGTPIDDIRTENEIKKIKLALEHGMSFSDFEINKDLPPELEGGFLDHIQEWEEQYAQRKMVSVFDLAEQPAFKPLSEVPENEIEKELDIILEQLHQHSVSIACLADVTPRELYRFVTEELMEKQVDDIRIEGMMHCFTYEDFYPNHEYDITNRCEEIIDHITRKDDSRTMAPWGIADTVWHNGVLLTKEEWVRKIIAFQESFNSFSVHQCELTAFQFNEEKNIATATGDVHFSGSIEGSEEVMEFKGVCRFDMVLNYEWWIIDKMELPVVI
ncbi:MAG: hypothetical protein K9G49_05810 [Taibaiella sp.]|nr:hypothetical protein [Taibaiella sp.]